MSMSELNIEAPAKINLFLAVLDKRTDGYHNISSVMQKIDLADSINLRIGRQGIQLCCPSSSLPANSSNLAWRAAKSFFEFTGIPDNLRITLYKKIPIAAGLGGGSSDAAAVLVGLDKLYGTGLGSETLLSLAAKLGADVPFFIVEEPTALATGTGTELSPFSGPTGYWLVLVNPGFAVPTRWVYENLILTTGNKSYSLGGSLHSVDNCISLLGSVFTGNQTSHTLFNDLEDVTITKYPEILKINDTLNNEGAIASLMSGSGPTVFGVFKEYPLAQNAFAFFQNLYRDVFLVNPL
ncbi:MAG: 4-(cytidine 5'-diphospho)-2-C-methyl-D-erythritol kinase [Desulfobulbaceae bacterium]|nr:4-(cytidine 5'-diphospho)-2-C-methyl-D-erythritol kinase [Desulfobulbaceae bacterium]